MGDDTARIKGTSREVGQMLGLIQRDALRARVTQMHDIQRDSSFGSTELDARVAGFRQCLECATPLSTEESFLPMVDGSYYRATDAVYDKLGCAPTLRTSQRTFEREPADSADWTSHAHRAFRLLQAEEHTAQTP